MKINAKALAITSALLWGGSILPVAQLVAQNPPVPARGVRVLIIGPDQAAQGTLVSLHGDTAVISDSVQRTEHGRFAGYDQRERTFALDEAARLHVLTGYRSHAQTGALIGGAVGFLIGAAVGHGFGSDPDAGGSAGGSAIKGGLVLGIPGMLIGAAIGSAQTPVWTAVDTRGKTVIMRLVPTDVAVSSGRVSLHWRF